MGDRLELNERLKGYVDNVYFQPPSNINIKYPCIIYHKRPKRKAHSNNTVYRSVQQYQLTLIEHDPDSGVADNLEKDFEHCTIDQYFTVDNLNHTTLKLYF